MDFKGERSRLQKGLTEVLDRNIQTLLEARKQQKRERTFEERLAETIGTFAGSVPFIYLHLLIYGGWLFLNSGAITAVKPWDPFPFVMLAMIASVEAIFLSTFVLINQNRMAALNEQRADLDLQVTLLTEHELTRLIHLTDAISRKVGAHHDSPSDLDEIKRDIPPELVIERMEALENQSDKDDPSPRN